MNASPAQPSNPVIPLRRRIDVGVAIGLVVGALIVLFDGLGDHASPSTADAARLVLFGAAAGVLVALPACLLLGLARNVACRVLSEPVCMAFLWGFAIQCACAMSLEGIRLLLVLPVPWLVAWRVHRAATRASIDRQILRALAVVLLVALLAAVRGLTGAREIGTASFLIGLGVFAVIAHRIQSATRRRPLLTPLACALPVGLVIGFGNAAPGWVSNDLPPASAPSTRPSACPNVVLIVLDTTRADHLGCHGSKAGLTPRLDAFAAESTVYLDSFTTGPWTLPSHASLFTGYYTQTHGCDTEPHRWLDDGFLTLPEMLAPFGYQSVAFVANDYVDSGNLLKGFDRYLMLGAGRASSRVFSWIARAGWPDAWADHGAADGAAALDAWLRKDRDPRKPFCLFVNLLEPHWPHHAPLAERLKYLPPGVSFLDALRVAERFYGVRWFAGQKHSPRDEQIIRALYAAEVAYQDRRLGQMLDSLRAAVDLDKTMVVITADHGENLGEAGRWDHMFALNDTLIHVPLIIRYPSKLGRGERVRGLNQLVDVVPTVFDLLGLPAPVADLPGRTLLPGRFQPRPFIHAQAAPYYGHLERMESVTGFDRDVHQFTAHLRAVRDDRYKLVEAVGRDVRLFDLANDPAEATDVARDYPDVVKALMSLLDRAASEQPPYKPRPGTGHRKQRGNRGTLRSIGYIQ